MNKGLRGPGVTRHEVVMARDGLRWWRGSMWWKEQLHSDWLRSRCEMSSTEEILKIGLSDLANKNTRLPISCEFQINKKSCFSRNMSHVTFGTYSYCNIICHWCEVQLCLVVLSFIWRSQQDHGVQNVGSRPRWARARAHSEHHRCTSYTQNTLGFSCARCNNTDVILFSVWKNNKTINYHTLRANFVPDLVQSYSLIS